MEEENHHNGKTVIDKLQMMEQNAQIATFTKELNLGINAYVRL